MPSFNVKQECIAIPLDFVKNIMPGANAAFVKVYLYGLMLSATGEVPDTAVIADKLQLLESDVVSAVKYWQKNGVFEGGAEETPGHVQRDVPPKSEDTRVVDIVDEAEENESLKEMLRLAQEVLGKTLSTAETKSLYWIYGNLKMPIEVILVLLEYCVSINKRSMTYIEQVAVGWNERGINTLEKADAFMRQQSDKDHVYSALKQIFSINSRDFTSIEINYLNTWTEKYKMSQEMIAWAYEYCVLRINKISFPYMDKIIEKWFEKGIDNVLDAEKDNENFKNAGTKKVGTEQELLNSNDVTTDEFEKIMWEKMKNED